MLRKTEYMEEGDEKSKRKTHIIDSQLFHATHTYLSFSKHTHKHIHTDKHTKTPTQTHAQTKTGGLALRHTKRLSDRGL